jgi:hypothetical protein
MHREQVEAVVQETIERHFGSTETLRELHQILKKTNVSTLRPGESDALPLNAGLFQSLFLSHVRLAQMFSDVVAAHQSLLNRVDTLEAATSAIQEAVLNLQQRVNVLEQQLPETEA